MASKEEGCSKLLAALFLILIKGLLLLAAYDWAIKPIFNLTYDLTYWQATFLALVLTLIF
jgi:hypothetical protein